MFHSHSSHSYQSGAQLCKAHLREIENDIPTFIGQQGPDAECETERT